LSKPACAKAAETGGFFCFWKSFANLGSPQNFLLFLFIRQGQIGSQFKLAISPALVEFRKNKEIGGKK